MKNFVLKILLGVFVTICCFSQTTGRDLTQFHLPPDIQEGNKTQVAINETISENEKAQKLHLSVRECREMALRNSEDMKIAQYRNEQSRNEKRIALAAALPKFSASGTYAYLNSDIILELPRLNLNLPGMGEIDFGELIPSSLNMGINTGMYMFGASVQQPIYAGGRIITGNKMAEKGIEITEENKNMTRMSVVAEAEKAYWTYFSVKDKINLLEKYEALLDTLYESVSNLISAEMATANELLKITSRKSNIQYQKQKAENGMELSRMQLCWIIGVDIDTEVVLTDSVSEEAYPTIDFLYDLTMRPEYRILQKQVELKELDIKNVRGNYLPTVGLMAGYNYLGKMELGGVSMRLDKPFALALLSVSIPIFNFGEGAKKIQNAKIARDIQQEELNKNSKLLTIEIEHAGRNLLDAFLLISTAGTALEQAEASLRSIQDNYEVGMGTLIDVLDAQTQWQEAYSNTIDARVQYKISEVEFLRVTGKL